MATRGTGGARRIPQRQKWPRHRRGRCVALNRPKRFLTKREHSVMSIYNWQILHSKCNPIQRSLCCFCQCCEWCVCVSECIRRRAMPRGGGTYLWPGQAAGEGRFSVLIMPFELRSGKLFSQMFPVAHQMPPTDAAKKVKECSIAMKN